MSNQVQQGKSGASGSPNCEGKVEKTDFSGSFDTVLTHLNQVLPVENSFDLIYRVFAIGERKACFYFVDGFTKDEVMQKLMQGFQAIQADAMADSAHEFAKKFLPYGEVTFLKKEADFIQQVLSGVPCLFIDGYPQVIAVDFRTYPARSVDEPEKDKSMRGSRDGFVETVVFNTALIRRRIRSTDLVMAIHTVGQSSKTDVVVGYMADRVDTKVLDEITRRIDSIKVDSLTMNQQSLAECLYHHKWYNPFPKFKYTERPDSAAAALLEGNIVILVDNSPTAMILPCSVFDIIEEADDYYFPPITGTYLRLSRFIINISAVILTPIFLLLMQNPQWIPENLQFIQITDPINVPLIFQLLLLEFAVDGLRLASLNTPSMLSTPLSVVAAIVLGDYTVSSGWFNSEIMLYMAFVAIANYTQVSFELGYALKFMRIILLILTAAFGVWGFTGGIIIVIAAIVTNKTISGYSYVYPLLPLNPRQLLRRFCRVSLQRNENSQN